MILEQLHAHGDVRRACAELRAAHPLLADLSDQEILRGTLPLISAGDEPVTGVREAAGRLSRLARALEPN